MLVKFNAKELKDVLTLVNRIEHSGFGISDLVYFSFSDSTAHVFGTNGIAEVSAEIPCSVEGDVRNLAFSKKKLLDIVDVLVKGSWSIPVANVISGLESDIAIEVDGSEAVVKNDSGVFKLKVEAPAEKESFVIPDCVELYEFSSEALAKALYHVMYASVAKTTWVPNVVYVKDGKVFYGSDNYRLARYEEPVFPGMVPSEVLILVNDAKLIVDAVNISKEKLGRVGFRDGVIVVEMGKYQIGVTCQNYLFPEFDDILAKEWECIISVNTKGFLDALKQVKKVGKEKYVEVEVAGDRMKLRVKNDYGEDVGILKEVNVLLERGEGFKKSFNIQYLIDALKVVKSKIVEVRCPSENEQVSGIDIFSEDSKYRAMVMEVVLL